MHPAVLSGQEAETRVRDMVTVAPVESVAVAAGVKTSFALTR